MRRYAELLADNRGFSAEEDEYFTDQAQHAYESFRDKAALSRGMAVDRMQEVAQVCGGASMPMHAWRTMSGSAVVLLMICALPGGKCMAQMDP